MADPAPQIRRGQVWWVDFSPTTGSEQSGRRPALVVSNDVGNATAAVVIVVPITSQIPEKRYPVNVHLPVNAPLEKESVVLCGQVRTVAKERLERYKAEVTPQQMRLVGRALAVAIGLIKP